MQKTSFAVFLLTVSMILTGCGQAGEQWMNPDTTFKLFDQPEVKGVNDTQETMAKEAMEGGEYRRAAQYYQQLVASDKGTPEDKLRYKMGLAESARRQGDNEPALAMYEELHRTNPENVDIAEGRALTMMASGKISDAGRAFSEVIEKDPKRWRSLNALGILFVTKNMIPEAMAYYTEALNQSPDNAAVLNNVGLSQAVDRKFPRAVEALEQGVRVSKSPTQRKQIELNLAMVQGVSGNMEAAREIAGKYLEGAALDNNLGLYAHLAKDDALAKSYLNMALSGSTTFYERAWENLDAVNNAPVREEPGVKAEPKPKAAAKPVDEKAAEEKPAAKPKSKKKR